MEGFVKDIEIAEEVDLTSSGDTTADSVIPVMLRQQARQGQTGPYHDDETIKVFRGLGFGVPVALGLWAAIIGVSAYLIA